jgi:phenylalanyl-tRNA synthetase beta chain
VRIVHEWLSELVDIPADVETVAREISLRGFEVASVEHGVIDFEITANRPDCLGHLGIAREAAVIWNGTVRPRPDGIRGGYALPVDIQDPELCPRYSAQIFDVQVGPSPEWLVRRLERAGVRSINNVVDVTNYVMLEIGHPMHAFDLERLAGRRLVIRPAREQERLRTLDGIERTLDPAMLVIADAERAVAVAGVMGGEECEIGATTTRMVLESAYFQPASIRKTSRRLNLKTEASTRFERGADIDATTVALTRAAELLAGMNAARAGEAIDVYPVRRTAPEIRLRSSRITRVLGLPVPAEDVERILAGLGFGPDRANDQTWVVRVPSFRPDVLREIDLIEEVGRHYGFDRLPVTFPVLAAAQTEPDARIERDRRIRRLLTAAGFSESMTFAFIERDAAVPFSEPDVPPAAIANPLSEKFAVLRPSLLPGLIDSCAHNRRRGLKDVRLFEAGSRFTATGEGRAIGLLWAGAGEAAHWSGGSRQVDFFDIKGAVELLCSAFEMSPVDVAPADAGFLVRGRAASVKAGDRTIAVLGQLLPAIAEARGLPPGEEVYVAEIDTDALAAKVRGDLRARSLPKYPAIVRDVSILVDEALPAAAVRGTIRSAAPELLQSIVEFDRYQGKGIPDGRLSLSLRLTFRSPERTLTDDEVEAAMNTIVAALEREHGAQRR